LTNSKTSAIIRVQDEREVRTWETRRRKLKTGKVARPLAPKLGSHGALWVRARWEVKLPTSHKKT